MITFLSMCSLPVEVFVSFAVERASLIYSSVRGAGPFHWSVCKDLFLVFLVRGMEKARRLMQPHKHLAPSPHEMKFVPAFCVLGKTTGRISYSHCANWKFPKIYTVPKFSNTIRIFANFGHIVRHSLIVLHNPHRVKHNSHCANVFIDTVSFHIVVERQQRGLQHCSSEDCGSERAVE